MKKIFLSVAAFILLAMVSQLTVAASNDKPADKPVDDQASWQRDLQAWRAKRAAGLQAPEGWLSLIALGWLKEGDNIFGYADDSRVQIAAKVPAQIGIVRLEKN